MGVETPSYQRKKAARPGELIAAARQEFAEHGYGDARLARVAKRAGVSNGTLYHYFSDKAELFQAVFRATFVEPLAVVRDRPMSAPLLQAIDRLFEDDTLALVGILLFEAERYPEPVGRIAAEVMARAEAMLSTYLKDAQRGAKHAPSAPLSLVSHALSVALFEKARGHGDWRETARAAAREHLRLVGLLA